MKVPPPLAPLHKLGISEGLRDERENKSREA